MHFLIGCLKHAFYRFGFFCFPALPHHSPAFTLISNAFLFISTAFALHSPAFPWQSPCIHLYVPCLPSYLFHPAPAFHSSRPAFLCIPSNPSPSRSKHNSSIPQAARCAAMRRAQATSPTRSPGTGGGGRALIVRLSPTQKMLRRRVSISNQASIFRLGWKTCCNSPRLQYHGNSSRAKLHAKRNNGVRRQQVRSFFSMNSEMTSMALSEHFAGFGHRAEQRSSARSKSSRPLCVAFNLFHADPGSSMSKTRSEKHSFPAQRRRSGPALSAHSGRSCHQ